MPYEQEEEEEKAKAPSNLRVQQLLIYEFLLYQVLHCGGFSNNLKDHLYIDYTTVYPHYYPSQR